jgi:hypothetical protein
MLDFNVHDMYSSPNIVRIIKSRRMEWEGRIARMGAKRIADRLLVGKPEGKWATEKIKTWVEG